MTHPSYLQLDRMALGEEAPELRAHVRDCARCTAYLGEIASPGPVPAWARRADATRGPVRWWMGVTLAGAAAAAAAAAVALLPVRAPAPWVVAKGMPSVAIYVSRDGKSTLWNGSDAVRPGDRLRLRVAPEGHRWIGVWSVDPHGRSQLLHEARLESSGEYLLPESWRVDAVPGPERLRVALDQAPVVPERAVWSTILEIPKAAAR